MQDRQEEGSLSRSSTDNKTPSLPLFPSLSTPCSILRDVNRFIRITTRFLGEKKQEEVGKSEESIPRFGG